MLRNSIHTLPLLQKLLMAGGFFAAAGFNPNFVYAQVGAPVTANTLPTGGSVAQGNATIGAAGIAANGRNTMTISQTSTAAILNWSSFNVGSNGTVSFSQPTNGVTLNRVNSNQGSEIYGQINATGSVFLVNPTGILFAPGAQVNVGSLVASTLDISDNNFILGSQTGNYQFNSTPRNSYAGYPSISLIKPGEIINRGTLTANGESGQGGTIALLGQTIKNEGLIAARLGTVAMAAGQGVSLQFQGSKLIKVQVSQAEFDTLIDNKGIIKADGGWVLMNAQTAAGLARAVVNHSGVIEAQTVADLQGNGQVVAREGKVEILADFSHGTVNASGTIDVSAMNIGALRADFMPAIGSNGSQNASQTAMNGGFVETSAATVQIADTFRVNALATNGKTGHWLIDPNNFTIAATGGNMSGSTVAANLATTNFEIQTATMGTKGGQGDILVNDTVSWSAATSLTLTAERNVDFSGGGSLNGSSVTLNAGSGSATGAVIGHASNTVVTAGTLIIKSQTGIGSASQTLLTNVTQAALSNSTSGGIYLTNTQDITVAARSVNGDIVIRTPDAIDDGFINTIANGAQITVGTVGTLVGLTTIGSGNISLSAGAGQEAPPVNFDQAGTGGNLTINSHITSAGSITLLSGHGGNGRDDPAGSGLNAKASRATGFSAVGGNIQINAALNAQGDIQATAGQGGRGGDGADGSGWSAIGGTPYAVFGTQGGSGANGGSITVAANITSATKVSLLAGAGGAGGKGGDADLVGGVGDKAGAAHDGGAGGQGGSIVATGTISAASGIRLTAGAGGLGARGGMSELLLDGFTPEDSFGMGGTGGQGGNLALNGALSSSKSVTLLAGHGGIGGTGYSASLAGVANLNGSGGQGGAISINAAVSAAESLTVMTGSGAANGLNSLSGSQQNEAGKGGALTIDAAIHAGDVLLQTGAGGNSISMIQAANGGAITINAKVQATGNLSVISGAGGNGLDTNSQNTSGAGGEIRVNQALSAQADATIRGGNGGRGADGVDDVTIDAAHGGAGANVALLAAVSSGGNLDIRAGSGGSGGKGGLDTTGTYIGAGGMGGSAGTLSLGAAVKGGANVIVGAGIAGIAGAGGLSSNGSLTASGSAGAIHASVVNIQASANLSVLNSLAPTSGSVTLHAGMNAGNTLTLNGVSVANTSTDNLSLQGATIAGLPGSLSANTIAIATGGAIGSSAAALQTNANALALQGSDVFVRNSKAVRINSVQATGQFSLDNGLNDVTLAGSISAGDADDAIRIAGGNFINNAGANALSATNTDPSTRWIVWSNSPLANNFGGIQSGNDAVWNTAYKSASPTLLPTQTGNRFVFRTAQPSGITVAASDVIKTYGETVDFSTASLGNGYSLISLDSGLSYGNAFTDAGTSVVGITLSGTPVLSSAGAAAGARRDGGMGGGATYAITVNTTGVTASNSKGAVSLAAPVAGTLTITPRALTGNVSATTRTYDGTTKATVASSSFTGLANGDTGVSLTPGSIAFSSPNAGSNIALTSASSALSGADAVNYTLASVSGSGTINKAWLFVRPNDTDRGYDSTTNGNNSGVYMQGFVNGETTSVLQGKLAITNQDVRNAGKYSLTPSGISAANYDIRLEEGYLDIRPAPITFTAVTETRMYDRTNASSGAPIITGLMGTDTGSGIQSFTGWDAGTYDIRVIAFGMYNSAGQYIASNYSITAVTAQGTITKAPLTITANNASRTYNGSAYAGGNGVSYSGFIGRTASTGYTNYEDSSVLGGSLSYGGTAQGSKNAGITTITPAGLTATNYDISFVSGNLTTTKANLNATANNINRSYDGTAGGNSNGVTITGFASGDAPSVVNQNNLSFDNTSSRNAGSYALHASGLTAQNYDFTYTSGNLTITPASLTITANNANMLQSQTVPLLSATYLGFVNGETTANLTTQPQINTSGNSTSPQGNYPIITSGAASPNYTISTQNGQLQIAAGPLPPVLPPSPPPPPPPPAPNPPAPAPSSGSPAPSPAPAPAGSPPAPAPAGAPATEGTQGTQGTQTAGNTQGNTQGNATDGNNNSNFAFSPETEEERALRLKRLGKLFTIVGGGVKP